MHEKYAVCQNRQKDIQYVKISIFLQQYTENKLVYADCQSDVLGHLCRTKSFYAGSVVMQLNEHKI